MTQNKQTEVQQKIDIVIAWVDGNDPRHRAKRAHYLKQNEQQNIPGAQETRFGNANELEYCLLSIFTFAPFINKVFIVTDEQTPSYKTTVYKYFPERREDIRIVDHKEIFKDFEEYLPVFNSRSIETMLWRIEGLSENFVYLNDDTFLVRPIKIQDWFIENKPVMRGKWSPTPILRLGWEKIRQSFFKKILKNNNFQPRPSFHMGQWNAASLLGFKYNYFILSHTPHTMNKTTLKEFFDTNPDIIKQQIGYRFRHHQQFNFIALAYLLELKKANRHITNPDLSYLQPYKRKKGYIDNKLKNCEADHRIKYMCVQSLELCEESDQKKVFSWLANNMNLKEY